MNPPPDTAVAPDAPVGPVDGNPASDGAPDDTVPPATGPLGLVALVGAFVALGFLSIPGLIVVLALVFMIFMHELGHYLTAKRAGMKVTEFFIGFGPRIWSVRRGETEYGVKAIWAGAYVKIIGMNNLEDVDPADESRTYRQKSYPKRLSVAVAGSAMHFAMAIVLLFLVFAVVGQTVNQGEENAVVGSLSTADEITTTFEGAQIDSDFQALLDDGQTPAIAAGLQAGDEILTIEGETVPAFVDLGTLLEDRGGDTVALEFQRGDEIITTDLVVGRVSDGENERGFIGVGPEFVTERETPWSAATKSVSTFAEVGSQSVQALVAFFSPSGLSDFGNLAINAGGDQPVDSPVSVGGSNVDSGDEGRIISIYGAARIGAQATEEGLAQLFFFLVLINIFIGVFNLVPLLPLDGGHVAVATYERIREFGRKGRYQADVMKLVPLTYAVVFILLTVGALALYADILDPVV